MKCSMIIAAISAFDVYVKVFISFQGLFQQLYFLIAFNPSGFRICLALSVSFHLVQAYHLLDSILVLLLDAELELELGQHQLDTRAEMWGVVFDQVCRLLSEAR